MVSIYSKTRICLPPAHVYFLQGSMPRMPYPLLVQGHSVQPSIHLLSVPLPNFSRWSSQTTILFYLPPTIRMIMSAFPLIFFKLQHCELMIMKPQFHEHLPASRRHNLFLHDSRKSRGGIRQQNKITSRTTESYAQTTSGQ